MKQFFLNTPTYFLSVFNISKVLDVFPACYSLFKSGISSELAENCQWPTTQWFTHVLAIPQQEHLQIF